MFQNLARVACNYRLESPPCTVLRPLTSKLMLDPTIQAEGSIVFYRNDGMDGWSVVVIPLVMANQGSVS